MFSHYLTPNTQSILLLCASFGSSRDSYPQPLSLTEYNLLTKWLRSRQLDPASLLESSGKIELKTCDCLEHHRLESLLERGMMLALSVEKWTNQGLWILGRGDSFYPDRLKQQLGQKAPAVLYGVGDIQLLSKGGLAIVGSRNVDEEGISYTEQIADNCSRQGIQIVSGGAKGVDTVAMLAALAEGGTVVGILADSLAKSAVSSKYRSAIQNKQLTLISAVDPQAGFNVGNAMGRNKYIYALADYGLVVSADYNKGGTWEGAVEALKKENSVPIFIRSEGKLPEGNKQLLKRGAKQFPDRPWANNLEQKLAEVAMEVCIPEVIQRTLFSENGYVDRSETEIKVESESRSNPESIEDLAEVESFNGADKIYNAVLPLILDCLKQPSEEKSLAKNLDVTLVQLRNWLKKAIDDGQVIKKSKPVRYALK
jgi:predicted Rossmann fold nucleotide-binding protein DprA/Smf involved in DNA uptake